MSTEFTITANPDEIRTASDWLNNTGADLGIPAEPLWRLELCLNEALANVFAHGGESALASDIRLRLQVIHGDGGVEGRLAVIDGGEAFDPLGAEPQPQPQSLDEVMPGGLGLLLQHRLADDLAYERTEGRNHLTFCVRWDESA